MRSLFQYLAPAALLLAFSGCNTLASAPVQVADGGAPVPAEAEASPGPSKTLTAPPLSPDLLYQLLVAEIAVQRGDLGLAAVNYLRVAHASHDPEAARRATRIAVYARAYSVAEEAAMLWVELDPQDVEARQSVAALLIRAGKVAEAQAHLQAVLELVPDKAQGFALVANLLGREPNRQRALQVMEQIIAPHRKAPDALYAYAQLAASVGEHKAAIETLDTALRTRPKWSKALVLKASSLRAMGRNEEALASFRQAVEADPKDTNLRLAYARVLVDAKRLEEAREQFRTLARQNPDNPDVIYALGLLALEADDLGEAERHFKRLLTLEQRTDEAAFSLGQIAEAREKWSKAIGWYDRVGKGHNYLDARIRTAVVLNKKEGTKRAREYLHRVEAVTPDQQVRLYLVEGEILREAKDYAGAKSVYDQALATFSADPELLYARAMVAERLGRLDLLEQDLRAILERDPQNIQALNALGYTLADQTNRYKEAYAYIKQAFEQSPEDAAIIDSMGWVLYRMGRHEEALQYLRRAVEMQADAEIAAHLGEVLWALGRHDEARKVWDQALKHAPEDEQLKAVIRRLTQ